MNNTKKDFRASILELINNQKEEDRSAKSLSIKDKLLSKREYLEANRILFYASTDQEVDTFEIMKKVFQDKKQIALPKLGNDKRLNPTLIESLNDIECGRYGIYEPKGDTSLSIDDIDLVVVPGVAFDKRNNRLGRGGGYYDRFLSCLPKKIPSIGLAFDFQIVDNLPFLEEHDTAVTCVLSN